MRSGVVHLGSRGELLQRGIEYEIHEANAWWWTLKVFLDCYFVFGMAREGDPQWTPDEILAFKEAFERNAEATWSRRWQVQAVSYRRGVCSVAPGVFDCPLPTVEVLVRVRHVREPDSVSHRQLWYVHVLHDNGTPPSHTHARYQYRPNPGDPPVGFVQVWQQSVSCGPIREGMQRGTDHEVGHMLGLPHPRGMCNEDECYGSGPERRRIMGVGSEVTQADYAWALRVMRLVNPEYDWTLITPRAGAPAAAPSCGPGAANWHRPARSGALA